MPVETPRALHPTIGTPARSREGALPIGPRPAPAREEAAEIALPALEQLVDLEDVVRADRGCIQESDGLRRKRTGDDEAEGGAPAVGAVDLDEGEIVAVGEEADAVGRDDGVADTAPDTVGQQTKVSPRFHPDGVYPVLGPKGSVDAALFRIPPGGIMPAPTVGSDHARDTRQTMATTDGRTATGDHADHFRHSYTKDKAHLVRRLARIEGQVRGIARMIEREEYCVDILQQTAALRAAVDSLSILVLEDHVQGCVRTAAEQGDAERYVEEVVDVVRRTLGRPIRSGARAG